MSRFPVADQWAFWWATLLLALVLLGGAVVLRGLVALLAFASALFLLFVCIYGALT